MRNARSLLIAFGAMLFLTLVLGRSGLLAQQSDAAFPAHRIVSNVYYVGSKNLASFLITTDQGHVLINSGFAETVPFIRASIEKLEFRFEGVKILLTSRRRQSNRGQRTWHARPPNSPRFLNSLRQWATGERLKALALTRRCPPRF